VRSSVVFFALFASATLAAGIVFWANSSEANWLVGVQDPDHGFVPKFKLPWHEQMAVSAFVGMKYGVAITLAAYLLHQTWLFLRGSHASNIQARS